MSQERKWNSDRRIQWSRLEQEEPVKQEHGEFADVNGQKGREQLTGRWMCCWELWEVDFWLFFMLSLKYSSISSAESETEESYFGFELCGHNLKLVQSTQLRDFTQLFSATHIICIFTKQCCHVFSELLFKMNCKMNLHLLSFTLSFELIL